MQTTGVENQTFSVEKALNGTINTTAWPEMTLKPTTAVSQDGITWDDATWILTSAFIIFTMQSGFGLLEAGCVSGKNEVNIMVKNACDVICGGLSYWLFGFGLSFGDGPYTNSFVGVGYFLLDADGSPNMGELYSTFIFQLSFATTSTTIVSGAMAERTKLTSYILFSFLNTVVYCIPAHWIWARSGFLAQMGCVDIAGSGGVHLTGGVSGLVSTVMLGPRIGRYSKGRAPLPLGNATNTLVGMFMLWWGWLGFNCGSTFGISDGKWKLAAKSAVTTLNASMGGGTLGLLYSFVTMKGKYDVADLSNSVLGALVAITAGCAVVRPWEAIVIGAIGALLTILSTRVFDILRIDDPVGAISVHGIAGIWGMAAVGLFVEQDPVEGLNNNQVGLFKGGGFGSLGVQLLACVCLIAWSAVSTLIILLCVRYTVGLRLTAEEEMLGADVVEHGISPQPIPSVNNNIVPRPERRSSFGIRRRQAITEEELEAAKNANIPIDHEQKDGNGIHSNFNVESPQTRRTLLTVSETISDTGQIQVTL